MLPQIQEGSTVFNPVFTLWFYCAAFCWQCQDQKFLRDEGIYEVYECLTCHQENRVAVR